MTEHPDSDKPQPRAEESRGGDATRAKAEAASAPDAAADKGAPAGDEAKTDDAKADEANSDEQTPSPRPSPSTASTPEGAAAEGAKADAKAEGTGDAPAEQSPATREPPDSATPEVTASEPAASDAAEAAQAAAEAGSPKPPAAAVPGKATIHAHVYGRSDVGQVREHNEDNLLLADLTVRKRGQVEQPFAFELGSGGGLLAVCDGMGGAAAGEIASQLAVDIVYERMIEATEARDRDRLAMAMVEALEYAGVRILTESNKNRACRGMGTTATVAAWVDDHLLLGQVGDSRAYLLRGERLVQVTRDQSLVNQLIEAGQLTEEEAENFEHSNIILQALGTADAVQVDLTFAELRRGDVLLLCSDGLSGLVRDDEMREILLHNSDPAEACRVLVEEANEAGGHDNITAIVAVFDGEALRLPTEEETLALRYRKYPLPPWMDHRNVDTGGLARFGTLDSPYDDTPYIEVHGEIELGPEAGWDDLLEDSPQIPTANGPSWSTVAIVAAVVGILIAFYFLMR